MEERIAKLEAISDSTVATVAALRTDMNDRFKLVDAQLAELRRQKVETEIILGRLDAQAIQLADLRQYIEHRFAVSREETNLRFNQVELRLKDLERQMDEQAYQLKEFRSEFRYITRWIMGTQFTVVLFLLGLAAKMFYPS
ncbi:hypothetical protein [Duganella violaceipulchra]|uniref:PAS domain-containing protein n=1 Tax=Duganella violaceipulchra TaxID=2849652 RepID=A0AA41HCS5_9BURK|nr:hypothetical protein [Duganella violaceicalia]MBV6322517.1 hypothetical protein [Duganella violaceicalia]MCP2010729.1 PAS domain-containing protein [Duganella violaceicalia]